MATRSSRLSIWGSTSRRSRCYVCTASMLRSLAANRESPAASEHLRSLIVARLPLSVQTIKDSQGKFGRYLAKLIGSDGTNINEQMVADGHALFHDY